MKCCYIVGAVPCKINFIKKEGDLLIAADGGYELLNKANIIPDIVLGDFDSLGYIPEGKEIIKHPVKKDDTDTLLAVKIGLERGYKKFCIYGGFGGERTDHTFSNVQTLSYIAQNGGIGYLLSDKECVTVIKNGNIHFKQEAVGSISVFAVGGKAEGVTEKGLLYSLDNYELYPFVPLGVSNSFVGEEAFVSVEKGMLALIWSGSVDFVQEVSDE